MRDLGAQLKKVQSSLGYSIDRKEKH